MAVELRVAGRRDLELTVDVSEDEDLSHVSEVEQVAQHFIPKKIPKCSWDCTRDVISCVGTGAMSVLTASCAAESSTDKMKTLFGIVSTIFGIFSVGIAIYGVTIRRCPATQRFWFR
jgi:hypothetical protein